MPINPEMYAWLKKRNGGLVDELEQPADPELALVPPPAPLALAAKPVSPPPLNGPEIREPAAPPAMPAAAPVTGDWGGSKNVLSRARALAESMHIPVTSQKRDDAAQARLGDKTSSRSDHYVGNENAYAEDYGVAGPRAQEFAQKVAAEYGIPAEALGTMQKYVKEVDGKKYEFQLLHGVEGHDNHVHLGVHAVPDDTPVSGSLRLPDVSFGQKTPERDASKRFGDLQLAPRDPSVLSPSQAAAAPTGGAKKALTAADHYGVTPDEAVPLPRVNNNRMALLANMGRAGQTMLSAASGSKQNDGFYDNIERQGGELAADANKTNDEYTKFKQALLMKRMDDKTAAQVNKKYNPDLADSNSAAYRSKVAAYMSTTPTADALKKFFEASRAAGVDPDLNYFDLSLTSGMNGEEARFRMEQQAILRREMQKNGFEHDDLKDLVNFNEEMEKLGVHEAYKLAGEARDANIEGRAILNTKAPPRVAEKLKVLQNDVEAEQLENSLQWLQDYLQDPRHQDEIAKFNPFTDINTELGMRYALARDTYRVAAKFGVPSGRDMSMIKDVVQDPRGLLNILSNRDTQSRDDLIYWIHWGADKYANTYGYGNRGIANPDGSSSTQVTPSVVDPAAVAAGAMQRRAARQPAPAVNPDVPNGRELTPDDAEARLAAAGPGAKITQKPGQAPTMTTPAPKKTPKGLPYVRKVIGRDPQTRQPVVRQYLDANDKVIEEEKI